MVSLKVLVSAGEASGDRYAAGVVEALRAKSPGARFFGCTGPEMRKAGVETVVDAASLSVVGLVEVVHHIPRIYGEYRKLLSAAERGKPDFAILTDSPDFHLRVAKRLKDMGIPVFYLVAPQAWAWREGRVKSLQRNVRELHCIFPFEEEFFQTRGVNAHYIGHPLAAVIRSSVSRPEFLARHRVPSDRAVIALCPGSREGEAARHLPDLIDAVRRIQRERAATFLFAQPQGTGARFQGGLFREMASVADARSIEGQTWDVLAHSDVALVASGTVTVETALLGTPMVSYYRVTPLSWRMGRRLVKVPHFTMVNLVAERRLVPELIQEKMTGEAIAREALRLLSDEAARGEQKRGLEEVRQRLTATGHPFEESAGRILASMARGAS